MIPKNRFSSRLFMNFGHFQCESSNFELEITNGKVALNVSGAIEIIKSAGPIFFRHSS